MNTKKNIIGIFGTSGMAREAGDIVLALNHEPLFIGQIDGDYTDLHHDQLFINESSIAEYKEIPFVIGIANPEIREKIAKKYCNQLDFISVIHPTATFGYKQMERLKQSKGTIVSAGARFTNNIAVGDFCIFNQNATIAHDCVIADYVHIAPNATVSGNVEIGKGAWVGAGAIINQGKNGNRLIIGSNSKIGSGAVVIDDCLPNTAYVGIPARSLS